MSEAKPDTPNYPEQFAGIRSRIEGRLAEIAPAVTGSAPRLKQSIRYSLLDGGKRLRPILTLAAAEACGGDVSPALPASVNSISAPGPSTSATGRNTTIVVRVAVVMASAISPV